MQKADNSRLLQQMQFLIEIDKVKSILRRGHILQGERYENDAEHSWHLAVMALILAEHSNEPVDVLRVVHMVLIHDLVEIDAGDTFAYDEAALLTQREREVQAADRIFTLLPADMADEFRGLWDEFEARQTPEARFAAALDRISGVLSSWHSQGGCWREAGVTVDQVKKRNRVIGEGSTTLWQYAEDLIDQAVHQGLLDTSR